MAKHAPAPTKSGSPGFSTKADVDAFKRSAEKLTKDVTRTRESARAFVKDLEQRAGIADRKR